MGGGGGGGVGWGSGGGASNGGGGGGEGGCGGGEEVALTHAPTCVHTHACEGLRSGIKEEPHDLGRLHRPGGTRLRAQVSKRPLAPTGIVLRATRGRQRDVK